MKKTALAVFAALSFAQGTAWANPDKAPGKDVQGQVSVYTQALLNRDRAAVESLLSKQMLNKIRVKGSKANIADPLGTYIEMERRKLVRELGGEEQARVEVTQVHPKLQDFSVSAEVSLNGRALPKSLRLVLEDEAYKVESANVSAASSSNYRVQNNTFDTRNVECSDYRQYTVPPASCGFYNFCDQNNVCMPVYSCFPSEVYLSCVDYACGWLNDSTYFVYTQPGASSPSVFLCDYNTFGNDFIIDGNGYGHCNDDC